MTRCGGLGSRNSSHPWPDPGWEVPFFRCGFGLRFHAGPEMCKAAVCWVTERMWMRVSITPLTLCDLLSGGISEALLVAFPVSYLISEMHLAGAGRVTERKEKKVAKPSLSISKVDLPCNLVRNVPRERVCHWISRLCRMCSSYSLKGRSTKLGWGCRVSSFGNSAAVCSRYHREGMNLLHPHCRSIKGGRTDCASVRR